MTAKHPRRFRRAVLAAAALSAIACASTPNEEPRDPSEAALRLFALANDSELPEDEFALLFGPPGDPDDLAALYDALAGLSRATEPSIVSTQDLAELDAVAVDLVATLEGGGEAHYSVRADRVAPDSFRVGWFLGPGVEWPTRPRPRGPGLTSSPAPR